MASIFISHASADRPFALRLASSLEELGYSAWIDIKDIHVGEDIPHAVEHALDRADYLVLVLTPRSVASSWCSEEWSAKYWEQVTSRRPLVLPVLLEDCIIPLFLRSKRYADFRTDYTLGLSQLASSLQKVSPLPGAVLTSLPSSSPVLLAAPPCYTEGSMNPPGRLVEVHVDLEVPYLGRVAGIWKPDEREQDAAWELYYDVPKKSDKDRHRFKVDSHHA